MGNCRRIIQETESSFFVLTRDYYFPITYLKPLLKQVSMNVSHFVGVFEACAIIMYYYLMSLNGNLVVINNQLLPYTSPYHCNVVFKKCLHLNSCAVRMCPFISPLLCLPNSNTFPFSACLLDAGPGGSLLFTLTISSHDSLIYSHSFG